MTVTIEDILTDEALDAGSAEPTLKQRAKTLLQEIETLRVRDLIEDMGEALYGASWDAEDEP